MSDYIKDNFLPEDHEQAEKELSCYDSCLSIARQQIDEDRLDQSIAWIENAKRSKKVLDELRDKHDKAWYIIKKNESKRAMDDLVESQKIMQKQLVDIYV